MRRRSLRNSAAYWTRPGEPSRGRSSSPSSRSSPPPASTRSTYSGGGGAQAWARAGWARAHLPRWGARRERKARRHWQDACRRKRRLRGLDGRTRCFRACKRMAGRIQLALVLAHGTNARRQRELRADDQFRRAAAHDRVVVQGRELSHQLACIALVAARSGARCARMLSPGLMIQKPRSSAFCARSSSTGRARRAEFRRHSGESRTRATARWRHERVPHHAMPLCSSCAPREASRLLRRT